MKTIKIYTGKLEGVLFEENLHPKEQVIKVQKWLKDAIGDLTISSNSPFVVEGFNKFGKLKGYNLEFYFNGKKVNPEIVFEEFEKPFSDLIFGD